jgi:hypothetical protein
MFKFGTPPSLIQLITDEIYEAERKLLTAHNGLDFATSEVAYQTTRIARLKAKLNENENSGISEQ